MRSSLFFTLFPPPKFLEMPAVGLDISDRSIKFTRLKYKKGNLDLDGFANQEIPVGIIEEGEIKDRQKLLDILIEFKKKYHFKYAFVSLPEQQAYIVSLQIPFMLKGQLREAIELQLEEYVPLSASEAVFDYEILQEPESESGHYHISVSILPKKMVEQYSAVLDEARIYSLAFETEAQAMVRCLVRHEQKGNFLIVDIGGTRTGFAVVTDGVVSFTSTQSNIGGQNITQSIKKNLGVSFEEAEKIKVEKGLIRSKDNEKLFFSLIPVVSALKDEILRFRDYWQTHGDDHHATRFEKIVLCGGQATLPGLVEYLASGLETKVEIGNPWVNILSFDEIIPAIDRNNALRYVTSLGLSLREHLSNNQ